MELLDLKNKMLDDLNMEELNFIYQNSYLNNMFYVGRKFEIEDQKIQYQNLKYFDKNIEIIISNFYKFEETMDIKYFNNMLPQLNKLYIDIFNRFEEFISNKDLIRDFTSLYRISSVLVKYLRPFKLKNYCYELWYRPLVRDIHPEILEKGHIWQNRSIDRLILPFAENGMYDSAIEAYELFQKSDFYKKLMIYFDQKQRVLYYKTDLAFKTNNFELIDKCYSKFLKLNEDSKLTLPSLNALCSLRSSEMFLLHYKKQVDYKLLTDANNFIKLSFGYFEKHKMMNDIPILTEDIDLLKYFHIEYFREPILELMYYLTI